MPSKSASTSVKRKRSSDHQQKPKKRARSESSDEQDTGGDEILDLQTSILESKKNYNNISRLIEILTGSDTDLAALASVALTKVFMNLLAAGSLTKKKGVPEKEAVVVQWLRDRYLEYKDALVDFITQEELALPALAIAMKILKSEGQYLDDSEEHSFPYVFLQQIIQALLNSESDDARGDFVEKYLTEFDDIRFYSLKAIK